jgi:peptidoglycan/LPS O-acetylase OafA/YrhL
MNDRKQISAKRFFGLDFLRMLAVSLILFSHTSWIYNSHGIFSKLQDMSGFMGVELFIVMSGFLIGGILYKQFLHEDYTLKDGLLFIYRRLMRIVPSYYLAIVINALIFLVFGFSLSGIWKYFFLLQNFDSPIGGFFPESWSLPAKETGYIFAVVLLLIVSNILIKTSKKLLFFIVVISLIVLTLLLKIYYNIQSTNLDLKQWSFAVRAVVIYRMDSVLIGVLLGYFYQNFKEIILSKRLVFSIIGILILLGLAACVLVFKFRLANAGWFWNVVLLPMISVAVCMFIPFLLNLKSPSETIEKIVGFVCKISYSIYLLHYSVILFLLKYFIDTGKFSLWQLNIFTLSYLLITIALSYLMYNYFEKPINEYRRKNLKLNDK